MEVRHPTGHRLHGHYRAHGGVGLIPNANIILMSMRWADPHKFCIIERLSVSVTVSVAVTAQHIWPLLATFQRQYTANETVNVSSFLPTSGGGRAFLPMAPPSVTQLVYANAAAGISGGTRVADDQAFGRVPMFGIGALGTGVFGDFLDYGNREQFPLILSLNEGFTVSWGALPLSTGTIVFNFGVEWAEVSN